MADEEKKITEIEDSLTSFSADTGADNGSDAFDNGDEFKHLYKATDGKTRKGMVASRHDDSGAIEAYIDNETGNIGINKTPTNSNHAVRVVDLQGKANKISPATENNLVTQTSDGDIKDAGFKLTKNTDFDLIEYTAANGSVLKLGYDDVIPFKKYRC